MSTGMFIASCRRANWQFRQLANSLRQLAGVLFTIFQYKFITKVSSVNQETDHFCN